MTVNPDKHANISAEFLRSILDYDRNTGVFRWKVRGDRNPQWNAQYAGEIAGWFDWKGYLIITIDYVDFRAHRLAWLYVTGVWPLNDVDHKDGSKANNRFNNLREASRSQNNGNARKRADNKSGHKGVSWDWRRKKWMAACKVDGKYVLKKRFDTKEEAIAAYRSAASKHFGAFARAA